MYQIKKCVGMSQRVSVCLDCTTTTEHCWSRWMIAPKRAVLLYMEVAAI
jgi:hypothetical protein